LLAASPSAKLTFWKKQSSGVKRSLEEQIAGLKQGRTVWLEPFKKWINEAKNAGKRLLLVLFAKKNP
jgi:hypothetical protein